MRSRILLLSLLLLVLLGGCAQGEAEPALSEEEAVARVMERIETDYPTGLGATWEVDVDDVGLAWKGSWMPWRDKRPYYTVRVVTTGPLDPSDPESPPVSATTVFEVDGTEAPFASVRSRDGLRPWIVHRWCAARKTGVRAPGSEIRGGNMSDPITETRAVGGFNRISLRAEYQNELIITQGEPESLTITAPADIMSRIEAEVENDLLKIRTTGSWTQKVSDAFGTTFSHPHVRYDVTLRDLAKLEIRSVSSAKIPKLSTERLEVELRGVGQIEIGDVAVENLEVRLDGAGRIDIAGVAQSASVTLSGSGEYRAPNLRCQKLDIDLTGVGRAVVWAVEELEVGMQGIGSIQYYGSPRVKQDVTAIGSVSHAGDK